MSLFPVRNPTGFKGIKIEKDLVLSNLRVLNRNQLPIIRSDDPPPPSWPDIGGSIAYDIITSKPYFSNGYSWTPINSSSSGSIESYGFSKQSSQNVPFSTQIVLSPWQIASSTTYHTLSGWDLPTGIYTSANEEILTVQANISWEGGISNLGDRTLKIQHMDFGSIFWTTVKESVTQADPDIEVQTTQECQMNLKLSAGDKIRVVVEHDSPVSLSISGGTFTTLSGFRIIS